MNEKIDAITKTHESAAMKVKRLTGLFFKEKPTDPKDVGRIMLAIEMVATQELVK